ncbi:MAG: hypothetical protein IPQ10_02535 [Saprospiraceae bacterium]|jgi:hypothetical protein|nr:hypothetical protein [Saprospiraceae bacterium]
MQATDKNYQFSNVLELVAKYSNLKKPIPGFCANGPEINDYSTYKDICKNIYDKMVNNYLDCNN